MSRSPSGHEVGLVVATIKLLAKLGELDIAGRDERLGRIHYDWIEACERAQATVRLLSKQLRRFLDDQVWRN